MLDVQNQNENWQLTVARFTLYHPNCAAELQSKRNSYMRVSIS